MQRGETRGAKKATLLHHHAQEMADDGLLRVEAVLGLRVDDALRPVNHRRVHLHTPVGCRRERERERREREEEERERGKGGREGKNR